MAGQGIAWGLGTTRNPRNSRKGVIVKCWICGAEANSGEHRVKASDLRSIFGHVRQERPVFYHTAARRNLPVKGINAGILKSVARICERCNNDRTQDHDRAWEHLSKYLRAQSPLIPGDPINLLRVFPGRIRASMLNVHLFFVKIFGCLIVENAMPIDSSPFSRSLVERTAHPYVHLAISPHTDGLAAGTAGYSDFSTAQILDEVFFASWMYVLDHFSMRVMYAKPSERRDGLIDSWHPSTITSRIRVAQF